MTFLLVGLANSVDQLAAAALGIAWAFAAITAGRALVVYGLLVGATRLLRRDDRIPLNWLHVLFWAGLRGARGLDRRSLRPAGNAASACPGRAAAAGAAAVRAACARRCAADRRPAGRPKIEPPVG
jgi:hypothetical protein